MELLQSEKKQMLIQQENEKMKERDDQYTQQLKDWRVQISERKKVHHAMNYLAVIILCVGVGRRVYHTEKEFTRLLQY